MKHVKMCGETSQTYISSVLISQIKTASTVSAGHRTTFHFTEDAASYEVNEHLVSIATRTPVSPW